MDKGSRSPVIDMARGAAMILVIAGHALELGFNPYFRSEGLFDERAFALWRLIYSFHVPVFFFISGLLVSPTNTKSFGKVAASALGLIFVVYLTEFIFGSLGRMIHFKGDLYRVGAELIETVVYGGTFYLTVTWFLLSIAIVHVVAHLFYRSNFYGRTLIGVSAAAVLVIANVYELQFMQMQNWPIGLFFFLAGSFSAEHKTALLRAGRGTAVALVLVGTIGILLYPFNNGCPLDPFAVCNLSGRPQFVVLFVSGLTGFVPLFLITAFAGMAAIFGACLLLQGTVMQRPLVTIGQNTLVLLVVNGVFFRFVQFGMDKVLDAELWWLSALLSVVLQLGLIKLSVALTQPLIRLCQGSADAVVSALAKPRAMTAA